MSYYSNINKVTQASTTFDHLTISDVTNSKRASLKSSLDKYTTFEWGGIQMYDIFGAFIVNNEDSLRFYNGAPFSNEYTQPQFGNNQQLVNVKHEVQKIDFTIAIYWISEEHYRYLMHILNPYIVSTLRFSFDMDHFYQVKLASREDSVRKVIGYEGTTPMYYSEMNLSFEVQGSACAYNFVADEWEKNETGKILSLNLEHQDPLILSDLDFPFTTTTRIDLRNYQSGQDYSLTLKAELAYNDNAEDYLELYNVKLINLPISIQSSDELPELVINYDSETGLLTYSLDDKKQLLTLLSLDSERNRIVEWMSTSRMMIDGLFSYHQPNYKNNYLKNIQIRFSDTSNNWSPSIEHAVNSRGRTNLI